MQVKSSIYAGLGPPPGTHQYCTDPGGMGRAQMGGPAVLCLLAVPREEAERLMQGVILSTRHAEMLQHRLSQLGGVGKHDHQAAGPGMPQASAHLHKLAHNLAKRRPVNTRTCNTAK